MDWREQLEKCEQSNDWKAAIYLADKVIKANPSEAEIYVRIIFILLDLLVEGQYTPEDHDYAAVKLKEYYKKSYELFINNAEYLFFLGYFIPIAEWYFGINDVSDAYQLRKKAMEIEPDNILFEWSYRLSDVNEELAGHLAEQLLYQDISKIEWLRSKGIGGKYIIGMIENSYQNYKN